MGIHNTIQKCILKFIVVIKIGLQLDVPKSLPSLSKLGLQDLIINKLLFKFRLEYKLKSED